MAEEEEMRLGKTLGIVLVALAAIGFAGAPTAPAMELCKVAGEECATENVYAEGTVIKAQASETKISTSLGTVTCKESNTEMETGGEAGSPLPTSFTALSFSGCTLGESKCEVGASHLPYVGLIEKTAKEQGAVTIVPTGEGNPSLSIICGLSKCVFDSKELGLKIEGGSPAAVTGKEVSLSKVSGSCEGGASWTVTYKTTSPEQVRIGQRPTVLCKVSPNAQGVCPVNQSYTGNLEFALKSGISAEFETSPGTARIITCNEAPMLGENFQVNGQGTLKELEFAFVGGACESTFPGGPVVQVLVNGSYNRSSFSYRSNSEAILTAAGTAPPDWVFTIEEATPETCKYRPTRYTWKVFSYSPMTIKSAWRYARMAGSGVSCPLLMLQRSESVVKRPGNEDVWVAKTAA